MKSSLAFVLLAAALSVVGCGGGSTSTTSSTRASQQATGSPGVKLSKSKLIEKADAICRGMNEEFAAHEPRNQSIAESARIVPHRVAVEQRVISELNQLSPPSAIARDLQRVIAFRNTLAKELAELAQVAKRRDLNTFHKLAGSKARVHGELLAAANGTGLKECGRTG
jgi:hypothetical protein